MRLHQLLQALQRLLPPPLRLVRVDGGRVQHLPRGIHHRHLAPGAEPGIDPHHRVPGERRLAEQRAHVVREDANGVRLRSLGQMAAHVALNGREQQSLGSVLDGQHELLVQRRAVGGPERRADARPPVSLGHVHAHAEHLLGLAAVDGQDLVRTQPLDPQLERIVDLIRATRIASVPGRVVGVLPLGAEHARPQRLLPRHLPHVGMVADRLRHDVARPCQRLLHRRHLVAQEWRCDLLHRLVRARLLKDQIGQPLQPLLAGHVRARAPLGLVGAVEVLELGQGAGGQQPLPQLGRHLSLLLDAGHDRLAAILQRAQSVQQLLQPAQLLLVEHARLLLPVAGDEGERVPLVEERDGGLGLLQADIQFSGDTLGVVHGPPQGP